MGNSTARPLTELAEPRPLGTVCIECQGYPVVAVALKEILKEEARVYERSTRPPGGSDPSCIVVCSDGKGDLASELRRLRNSNPRSSVFVFGIRDDPSLAQGALLAGAKGFLHAGMSPEQIVSALRLASSKAEHEAFVPQKPFENKTASAQEPAAKRLADLTPRQREILGLVCEGLSNAQVAQRLFLTESTVKQHLYAAYRLLEVRNRVQATKLVRSDSNYAGGHRE